MKKIGIWMDKRVAKILTADNGGELLKTVDSNVEEFHPVGGSGTRSKGGPQDVVHDSKYTEREKHQLKAYFKDVISQLPDFEDMVIFGPSQTGKMFKQELLSNYKRIGSKLKGVETTDSMTDNQLVAWVKDYYK